MAHFHPPLICKIDDDIIQEGRGVSPRPGYKQTSISLKKLRKEVSGNLAKELLSAAQLSTPASQQPAHNS